MEEMTRVDGWEGILLAEAGAAAGRPFVWGEHDCMTWAFGVAAKLTGRDSLMVPWAGKYKTEAGAARCLRKGGAADVIEAGCILLGDPLPSPLLAQRGDLVIAEGAFGVCLGAMARFVGPDGARDLPLTLCTHAWRI